MADEAISQMPDAGTLTGTERVPIVRLGSPNQNLSTNTDTIASFIGSGITYYELNNLTSFTLPNGTITNETVVIVDNLGLQESNQPVISATSNIPLVVTFPYGSAFAFWNGSMWIALLPSISVVGVP